jgi:hypothetical protein
MRAAGHCATCTCRPGTKQYCDGEIRIRHERFLCLEPQGHDAPHKGSILPPPCPSCGGYELHAEDCLTPDLMADNASGGWVELTWWDNKVLTPAAAP